MTILIVDDEVLIRNVIKDYCINESYKILEAENGIEAVNKVREENIDLIVLDIMMPKLDGFEALKEIKKIKDIPVIVLSARKEEYDKLLGFNLGIDDYVIKPFSPKELMARIKAVLKRDNCGEEFNYKTLKIDYKGRTVFIDETEINLTPKEYELLCFLIKNKNIALSREQLLNSVWSYDFYGDARTIDTHIKMLRRSLKEYGKFIKTVRGMGYKIEIKKE